MAIVTALISYPVKSCAGTAYSAAQLTEAGLAHDRTFMVVGPDGVLRSQRSHPRLATIRPEIDEAGRWLTLHAEAVSPFRLEVDLQGPARPVTLATHNLRGIDQGDRVAYWLSEVLDDESRLVRVPPEYRRVTDGITPGTSGFADSSPVHLISTASLAHLNDSIIGSGGTALPMNRFRPNIVVDGWPEPHHEDRALRIAVGDAELGFAKTAVRCAVTTVDQHAGTKAGVEPLRTLATYRRSAQGVLFGAKFSVLRPAHIAVGDDCVILESRAEY